MTEKDIQRFLWSSRARWTDLVDPIEMPDPFTFAANLSDISPQKLLYNHALNRLRDAYRFIKYMELIGCEVPLEKSGDATIRADFLGAYPGTAGLSIVELKKSTKTERESFTELLAYSHHLTGLFPTACADDIVLVLIAPMETRIVREAFLHTILFSGRKAFALVPYFTSNGDVSSLRLRPWIPEPAALTTLTQAAFNPKNFNVFKTVWRHTPGWWDPEPGSDIDDDIRMRLNQVSALAAQELEARGIHGFAFASQLWPELAKRLPYTNSLVLAGLNPYAVAHDMYLLENGARSADLTVPTDTGPNLANVILGLELSAEDIHANFNYLAELSRIWDAHLARIGLEVVERCIQTTEDGGPPTDSGSMTWDAYQQEFLEYVSCHNLTIRPTGILRRLYWDVTKLDYDTAVRTGVRKHPVHGDMFRLAVETLGNHTFFRKFLDRMFDVEEDD